jgi:hypothetical protein
MTPAKKSNDGRWLIGWLLRLCGAALLVGAGLGAIGALLKWGVDLPPTPIVTMSVLTGTGLCLGAAGHLLMKASPRVGHRVDGEVER